MIVRRKDGTLESLTREDYLTDDIYYMKCADLKGITLEALDNSIQMDKILSDITASSTTKPPNNSHRPCTKSRHRINSTEK